MNRQRVNSKLFVKKVKSLEEFRRQFLRRERSVTAVEAKGDGGFVSGINSALANP